MPQSVVDQEQLAPVRLLGVLPGRVAEQLGHALQVRVQPGGERRRGRNQGPGIGQLPVQFLNPAQVFAQDLLRLQTHGQRGGIRSDERIAVAVAADP